MWGWKRVLAVLGVVALVALRLGVHSPAIAGPLAAERCPECGTKVPVGTHLTKGQCVLRHTVNMSPGVM